MKFEDLFKKKTAPVTDTADVTGETPDECPNSDTDTKQKEKSLDQVAPKSIGVLDMDIAFDTTGSRYLNSFPDCLKTTRTCDWAS